jgi:hypothetical protein
VASQEFVYRAPVAGLSFAYELLVRPIDWRSIDRDPGLVSASAAYPGAGSALGCGSLTDARLPDGYFVEHKPIPVFVGTGLGDPNEDL